MPNSAPLRILHYFEPHGHTGRGVHHFTINKTRFSLTALEQAEIEEATSKPQFLIERTIRKKTGTSQIKAQLPFFEIQQDSAGLAIFRMFPYGRYWREGSDYNLPNGNKGVGAQFGAKVFKYLSQKHGVDVRMMALEPISPQARRLFSNANLDVANGTVGQYAQAFHRLVGTNRLKQLQRQTREID